MLVLLAALPYLAAGLLNWLTISQLFKNNDARDAEPDIWRARLLAPVAIGGLTPIALAARKDIGSYNRDLLLLAAALACIFTVILIIVLGDNGRARKLHKPVAFSKIRLRRLTGWRIVQILGTGLLAFGAVANIIVARG